MGRRRNIDKGSYAQLMLALLGDQGAGTIEVLANHTEIALPSTTTAITTGATAMGTISLTAKGPSNFRIEYAMQLNALNTLQAVITPTVSFTANGVDTITATLPAMAFPPNTSSPTTGILSGFAEASAVAALAANTTIPWAPKPGQTIIATLSLTGSATGGSVPASLSELAMQEIF